MTGEIIALSICCQGNAGTACPFQSPLLRFAAVSRQDLKTASHGCRPAA